MLKEMDGVPPTREVERKKILNNYIDDALRDTRSSGEGAVDEGREDEREFAAG